MNKKNTVILGVTSGIAAYKTLSLIKQLRAANIAVFVIMTNKAEKMIPKEEFAHASGNTVYTELFEKNFDYKNILKAREVDHIVLADKAEVLIIAPATANIIAKLAHGIADDFLTTTTLALTAPIILCPSMNVNMWHNPVVQENIEKLKTLGYIIVPPAAGMLACGYEGVGRLAEITDIKEQVLQQLHLTQSMKGKKIIVTAGGTKEKIDDVRFITNRSSGKMGVAIAEACYERGSDVLLLRAKNSVAPRYHLKEKLFETSQDLMDLLKQYAPDYDMCFHNAAVSDFTVKEAHKGKLSSEQSVKLTLLPQTKIVGEIKKINPKIRLIAFKAVFDSDKTVLKQKAGKKLQETQADAVIANDISTNDRGFESDTNEALIVLPDGKSNLIPLGSKKQVAEKIVDYINEKYP